MNIKKIVFITLDGFRKDKIDLCPTLNSIKNNGIYFPGLHTVTPYTFASHHAIFSGMYPARNGVNGYFNMFRFKKDEITTLAELLQKNGYYTVSETLVETVLPRQGFDEYNLFEEDTVDLKSRHKELIDNLASKEKFFVFLHFTDTHLHYVRKVIEKYEKSGNDDEFYKLKNENNQKYEACTPLADDYIRTIRDALDKNGILDETLIVIISDHGTSLGEKYGEKFYGVFVYDYTINVFCILNNIQLKPKIVTQECRTIDLFPTIVDLTGIENTTASQIQGESLMNLVNDDSSKDRVIFVETGGLYGPWPSPKRHNVFCIKTKKKKLIYNDEPETWEFYDLENDPDEENNIYDKDSDIVTDLKEQLLAHFKENNIDTKISMQ